MKKRTIVISLIIIFILCSLSTISVASVSIDKKENGHNSNSLFTSSINIDLKVRAPGGDWQDISITANAGTDLEFKLDLTSSGGGILVVVLFPFVNEEPMLQYKLLSASHIPEFIDETLVMWGFVSGAPDTITFKAEIKKSGTGNVDSSICDVVDEITDEDSVQITGNKVSVPKNKQLINLEPGIYVDNAQKMPFPITIFVGDADIEIDAEGANRVEFYIDDDLKETDATYPYSWTWDEFSFGKHTLTVKAYDETGNSDTDEMKVWKFF